MGGQKPRFVRAAGSAKTCCPFFMPNKKELIISSFALKIITFVYAILKISAPDYLLERGNLHG